MDKHAKYSKSFTCSSNGQGARRTSDNGSSKDGSCLSSLLLMLSVPAGLIVWGVSYFL